jgi:Zn-finger nucleic acid-binding protein
MRSYERNGVLVDQCTGCKGIFLDRGELERLTEAENTYYEREHSRGGQERKPKTKKQKARSFLENLMEGGE